MTDKKTGPSAIDGWTGTSREKIWNESKISRRAQVASNKMKKRRILKLLGLPRSIYVPDRVRRADSREAAFQRQTWNSGLELHAPCRIKWPCCQLYKAAQLKSKSDRKKDRESGRSGDWDRVRDTRRWTVFETIAKPNQDEPRTVEEDNVRRSYKTEQSEIFMYSLYNSLLIL